MPRELTDNETKMVTGGQEPPEEYWSDDLQRMEEVTMVTVDKILEYGDGSPMYVHKLFGYAGEFAGYHYSPNNYGTGM